MKQITYLLMILIFIASVLAFTPLSNSPLATGEHPRIHITDESLPKIRQAISADPFLREKYQEYVNWAKDQDINSKDNTIDTVGHQILHPQLLDQALIAQIGEVPGVTFPTGWTKQRYADVAIDTLRTRLEEGSSIAYAAAITYDWTYDFMSATDRQELAQMLASAKINNYLFDVTVNNPSISGPSEMFSSRYYESAWPYYIALAIDGEVNANDALDSFYSQMLNYGYFDGMDFAGADGGWNEWIGYGSWHPKNHILNIDAWRTATNENYITGENVRVQGKAELGQIEKYAKFIHYAIDPHHYVAESNSPMELDTYAFIKYGAASTTDASLDHNEKKQELWFLGGMLEDMGATEAAGLVRDFNERYKLNFIDYKQHWSWAFIGAEGSLNKISPVEANLPKSFWAKNQGTFFARTGFTSQADGVFSATDSHYRYSGHNGADDFPGFSINKFGTLVNTRYVAHRGYGNLDDYVGAYRDNVIDFGLDRYYKEIDDKNDLQKVLEGDGSFDHGGIEQTTALEDVFYHVSSDTSRLYSGVTTSREYVWLPGSNPENDMDLLVVYDRTSGSQLPRWVYHVPWLPTVSGQDTSTSLTTGSGATDTLGTRYTGSNTIIKELNGLGGEDDADEHFRGTDYTAGANAHGVLFAKTLLPKTVHTDVTRVAYLDDDVLNRQNNLAINSHRWQVAVVPTTPSNEHRFLNVMQAGEENKHTSMLATSLIQSGDFDGVFIARENNNRPNYVVLFNTNDGVYDGSLSYVTSATGTVRHVIVGLDPSKQYTVDADTSFTVSPVNNVELWNYADGNVEEVGVITFETTTSGTVTISQSGTAPQSCTDGTFYSSCSQSKPKYCSNGNLINDCSNCGCESGQTCQTDGTCETTQTCQNGQTQNCQIGLQGICAEGTQTCSNNEWSSCTQNNQATSEICGNGIDEDCNGLDEPCSEINADLTDDGKVNQDDFSILNSQYGSQGSADYDNDGIVNLWDLTFLGKQYVYSDNACGNGICDIDETSKSCSSDCPSNTEYLSFDDFEGSTSVVDPFIDSTDSSITTEEAHSGSHSLKMCAGNSCKFSYYQDLGESSDTIYSRYWFKIGNSEAWFNSDGSPKIGEHYKNPGLSGGSHDCKGGDYTGDDCLTVRSRLVTPNYGVWLEGSMGYAQGLEKTINVIDDKWHCFETKVKLNTPGQNDGEVIFWVDGNENKMNWYNFRGSKNWQIGEWWWTYWSNDNWLGPTYVDDFVISKERIYC